MRAALSLTSALALCVLSALPAAAGPRRRPREAVASANHDASHHAAPVVSVGAPNDGRLAGGGAHLDGAPYLRVVPVYAGTDNRWGLPALVHMLNRGAKHVAKLYPGAVMSVGDLSRKGGGDVDRHHSHESGRDADVAFYVMAPNGTSFLAPRFVAFAADGTAPGFGRVRFDEARNWALVASFLTDPEARISHIFLAPYLRARLLEYAARSGAPAALRARAALALSQPKNAQLHDDHFHVRVTCPDGQHGTCVEFPLEDHRPGLVARRAHGKTRPVLARSRKRGATGGAAPPAMAGVMPAGDDFGDADADAREVVDTHDESGEPRVTR